MSRIFDALRRAGIEQSGVEYRDIMSVATEVFESQEPKVAPELKVDLEPAELPAPIAEASAQEYASDLLAGFPSREVVVPSTSKLAFLSAPESLAAEKFRFLGVRLRELRQSRQLKKVLVTSTIPEEGKSVVSANLAGVLSRKKEKVLLIEGDMRRPVLAERFGLGKLPGLAEWLQNGYKPSNIYRLGGAGFWLMPAGEPPERPLELMQSGKLSQLMQQLVACFDWIVMDTPPVLPLADTTLWSRLADGVLLVTREGVTQKSQLERGLEILKKSDLLGVVLNSSADPDQNNYYQRYSQKKK